MNISNEGIQITKRFFDAIEVLRANKEIRGVQTFTRNHGLNYWNVMTLRKEPDKHVLFPEYIKWLCEDYGISIEWIMFGTGFFYNRQNKVR